MPHFATTEQAPQQQNSAENRAADHPSAALFHAPATDTLAAALNRSSRSQSLTQMRQTLDESPRVQSQLALQRALDKRERPGKGVSVQKRPNATGLPDQLKDGVESLSGLAMDDVRVYYNSSKPAAVQAHAYAQGTDIHVAPGQERHLPHEAWHVVQQKQGRVKPTLQMKGVAINDDTGLECEASHMGQQALDHAAPQRVQARSPLPGLVSPVVQHVKETAAGNDLHVELDNGFKAKHVASADNVREQIALGRRQDEKRISPNTTAPENDWKAAVTANTTLVARGDSSTIDAKINNCYDTTVTPTYGGGYNYAHNAVTDKTIGFKVSNNAVVWVKHVED